MEPAQSAVPRDQYISSSATMAITNGSVIIASKGRNMH